MLIASMYEVYKRLWLTELYNRLRKELAIDVSKMIAEQERAKKPWLDGMTIKDYYRTIVLRNQTTQKLAVYRPTPEGRNHAK